MNQKIEKRASFGSKFGVLAAAAGSAIGLGNIWKFPYITGQNGGAAFLFVYLGFILAVGIPIMIAEFVIGRRSQSNAFGSFRKLGATGLWKYSGAFGVLAAFMILAFYGVVAGWSLRYIFSSMMMTETLSPEQISQNFTNFISNPILPIVFQLIIMIITSLIVAWGVQKGIEKSSKVLMPILLILVLALDVKSVSLQGASEGLNFLFNPDFSKLTLHGVLLALGHAFFSLSLGMGVLITYGSYIKNEGNLAATAVKVASADTLVAILAGVAIIPAVYSFGMEPSQGPGLIFVTLPNIFQQMQGGAFFGTLFFVLLTIAALTSAISIMEVVVAYAIEEMHWSRTKATILVGAAISAIGVVCSLSMGVWADFTIAGKNFFDLLDFISSNILLPFGGFFIALFLGWKVGEQLVAQELAKGATIKLWLLKTFMFVIKFLAPVAILIVFITGLM